MDEALREISQKVRRLRHRPSGADRWAWRGAKAGFVAGSALSLIFAAIAVVNGLIRHRGLMEMGELLGMLLPFALGVAIFLALLSAAIFLVFGTVVKPIFIALFCSVERFEQEYGRSRK